MKILENLDTLFFYIIHSIQVYNNEKINNERKNIVSKKVTKIFLNLATAGCFSVGSIVFFALLFSAFIYPNLAPGNIATANKIKSLLICSSIPFGGISIISIVTKDLKGPITEFILHKPFLLTKHKNIWERVDNVGPGNFEKEGKKNKTSCWKKIQ